MTNKVVRYSESRMKCSFLTMSAKLRVIRLPLELTKKRNKKTVERISVKNGGITTSYLCFFSKFCRLPFKLL